MNATTTTTMTMTTPTPLRSFSDIKHAIYINLDSIKEIIDKILKRIEKN